MAMNSKDASDLVLKLRGEGVTQREIADALKAKGYVSAKTGEPLTQGGVSTIIMKSKAGSKKPARRKKKRVVAVSPALSPKAARGKLDAVKRLLSLTDVEAEDRIAMVQLLLG